MRHISKGPDFLNIKILWRNLCIETCHSCGDRSPKQRIVSAMHSNKAQLSHRASSHAARARLRGMRGPNSSVFYHLVQTASLSPCSQHTLTCWSTTGVSTAFSSPVGGLLLMLEEGASFLSVGLFWRGFLATCTGVLTLHFLAQWKNTGSHVPATRFGIRRDLG